MRFYNATSFVFRRNYALRMFALCFGAVHVPLISFVVVSATRGEWDISLLLTVVLATVVGSALAIAGIAGMLAPVSEATRTLRAMRDGAPVGRIPVGGPDMAGELLETVAHAVRQTRERLDGLEEIANSDPLTGLVNRRGFTSELAQRESARGTLVLLDGDNFKQVNDSLGHIEGDRVLRMLAVRLSERLRPVDVLSRWGGDEFAVFLPNLDRFETERVIERLQTGLRRRPITTIAGRPFSFTAGFATLAQGDEASIERAFAEADDDMYRRKSNARPDYIRKPSFDRSSAPAE